MMQKNVSQKCFKYEAFFSHIRVFDNEWVNYIYKGQKCRKDGNLSTLFSNKIIVMVVG